MWNITHQQTTISYHTPISSYFEVPLCFWFIILFLLACNFVAIHEIKVLANMTSICYSLEIGESITVLVINVLKTKPDMSHGLTALNRLNSNETAVEPLK